MCIIEYDLYRVRHMFIQRSQRCSGLFSAPIKFIRRPTADLYYIFIIFILHIIRVFFYAFHYTVFNHFFSSELSNAALKLAWRSLRSALALLYVPSAYLRSFLALLTASRAFRNKTTSGPYRPRSSSVIRSSLRLRRCRIWSSSVYFWTSTYSCFRCRV